MWKYNQNDSYIVGDELYHYGVKGMKWKHHKKYSNDFFSKEDTITVGGVSKTTHIPGQQEKINDELMAKNKVRKAVNKANPYKWDTSKSVSKNVEKNYHTYKRRKKLKKAGYSFVSKWFKNL